MFSSLIINKNNIGKYLIPILVVSIFIFIYILYNYIVINNYKNHINGLYRGTNEFLEVSNLDNIIMYIDDKKGYIIINKDENTIFNETITFNHNLNSIFNYIIFNDIDIIEFKVKIPEIKNEWIIDKDFYNVRFSSINNTMEIYNNDTIFAILQREPEFKNENNKNETENINSEKIEL